MSSNDKLSKCESFTLCSGCPGKSSTSKITPRLFTGGRTAVIVTINEDFTRNRVPTSISTELTQTEIEEQLLVRRNHYKAPTTINRFFRRPVEICCIQQPEPVPLVQEQTAPNYMLHLLGQALEPVPDQL